MKKTVRNFLALFFAISMILMLPTYAASARVVVASPSITFNGTTATCGVMITADKHTDKISASMELWQGNTLIDNWSGSGTWIFTLEGTTTVSKNKTYDLVVNYSVNGVEKVPISISRTNK